MNRFRVLGALLLTPALAALLALPGCSSGSNKGKAKSDASAKSGDSGAKSDSGKKGGGETVQAKYDAVIKGRVVYDGTPPKMGTQEAILKHKDKDYCLKAPEDQKVEQTWIIGKDKGVAYTIVYLEPVGGGKFEVPDAVKKDLKPVVLDQPYCEFVPHLVALYPAGQKLHIKNSAEIPHNTKIQGDSLKNPTINKTLQPKSEETISLKYQSPTLKVQCDIHNWMNAQIKTFQHPYFAVTDKDGNFEIHNAPSGVPVQVNLWHSDTQEVKTGEQTFKTGANGPVELKIKKKS